MLPKVVLVLLFCVGVFWFVVFVVICCVVFLTLCLELCYFTLLTLPVLCYLFCVVLGRRVCWELRCFFSLFFVCERVMRCVGSFCVHLFSVLGLRGVVRVC